MLPTASHLQVPTVTRTSRQIPVPYFRNIGSITQLDDGSFFVGDGQSMLPAVRMWLDDEQHAQRLAPVTAARHVVPLNGTAEDCIVVSSRDPQVGKGWRLRRSKPDGWATELTSLYGPNAVRGVAVLDGGGVLLLLSKKCKRSDSKVTYAIALYSLASGLLLDEWELEECAYDHDSRFAAMAVSAQGHVYVSDTSGAAGVVHMYTLHLGKPGEWRALTHTHTIGHDALSAAGSVFVDAHDRVFVADRKAYAVTVLHGQTGRVLASYALPNAPGSVTVTREGAIVTPVYFKEREHLFVIG
jgi:hypothetical protein